MISIHAPFTTEVECKMASFTHEENFGVHAPRLIRIDGHDPVRVSLEAPLKYGPELQLGIMQLEREGSPQPGLRLPQAKLSRKSNQVARGRIRRFESYMPSQPVRSPRVKKRMSLKRRSTARSDAGPGISRSCMAATAPRSSTILFNARNASRSMSSIAAESTPTICSVYRTTPAPTDWMVHSLA